MFSDLLRPSGLGVTIEGGLGTIRVHSQTAESIRMHILNDADPKQVEHELELLQNEPGIWSATDALAISAMISPVEGSWTVIVAPPSASTHWPSMYRPRGTLASSSASVIMSSLFARCRSGSGAVVASAGWVGRWT